jgi:hypothetical protein
LCQYSTIAPPRELAGSPIIFTNCSIRGPMNAFSDTLNDTPILPSALGSGGLDWLAIWRAMYDAEHAQTEALLGVQRARAKDRWAGKAGRFAQSSGRAAQPDAFMRAVLPHLRPTDIVLDLGAGTGRHALFLSSQVAQVVGS